MQQAALRHPVARIKLQVKVFDQSITHGQDSYSRHFTQKNVSCKGYSNFGLMAHLSKRACLSIDEISTASCAEPQEYSPRVSIGNAASFVHQFLVLANPFDSLKDLRRLVQEKYQKLYPSEILPIFPFLKDENGCDLDDDYMIGEVYEPNDVVIILSTSTISSNGVITPQSISITPIQNTVELAVPTPKGKLVPLFADTASGISSNELEAEKNQIVASKVPEEAASEESSQYESSEFESEASSSSSYEDEGSEGKSSADESVIVPTKSTKNTSAVTTVQSVDDQIAAIVKDDEEDSSSEYEVDASSTESETDSEEVEVEKVVPSLATTEKAQAPVESGSSSEYETDSDDSTSNDNSTDEESDPEDTSSEDETPAVAPKREDPKPVGVSSATESSSESEEEETETESEEESDSSEDSGDENSEQEAVESSSSESDISSESDDEAEKVIPSTNVTSTLDLPITADDVQQVLKEVPKYTSLTTLKDCLSLAVSGRATPLQPLEKPIVPSASQPIKKGRVTLPRRKTRSNSNSGYDASLFR
jgi:hypothetical protein